MPQPSTGSTVLQRRRRRFLGSFGQPKRRPRVTAYIHRFRRRETRKNRGKEDKDLTFIRDELYARTREKEPP